MVVQMYIQTYRTAINGVHPPDRHLKHLTDILQHLFKRLCRSPIQQQDVSRIRFPVFYHGDFFWWSHR